MPTSRRRFARSSACPIRRRWPGGLRASRCPSSASMPPEDADAHGLGQRELTDPRPEPCPGSQANEPAEAPVAEASFASWVSSPRPAQLRRDPARRVGPGNARRRGRGRTRSRRRRRHGAGRSPCVGASPPPYPPSRPRQLPSSPRRRRVTSAAAASRPLDLLRGRAHRQARRSSPQARRRPRPAPPRPQPRAARPRPSRGPCRPVIAGSSDPVLRVLRRQCQFSRPVAGHAPDRQPLVHPPVARRG